MWRRDQLILPCFLAALLCLAGSGCGAVNERLVGWYITRKLDGYLDFDSAQKREARARVDETLLFVRKNELPHWVSFLREVRQGVHDGLDEASLSRLQRHYDMRLDTAVALLLPRFSPMLAALDGRQVDHFAARMREDVEDQYEELELPEAKRRAAIEKRALKATESSVGDLSDGQEQAIRLLVRALPNERVKQHRSALAHVERFRVFMKTKPGATAIESELASMWEHRYDALGPGRDKTARRAEQRVWLLAVYKLLTAEQRAHMEEQLSERITMLKHYVIP